MHNNKRSVQAVSVWLYITPILLLSLSLSCSLIPLLPAPSSLFYRFTLIAFPLLLANVRLVLIESFTDAVFAWPACLAHTPHQVSTCNWLKWAWLRPIVDHSSAPAHLSLLSQYMQHLFLDTIRPFFVSRKDKLLFDQLSSFNSRSPSLFAFSPSLSLSPFSGLLPPHGLL